MDPNDQNPMGQDDGQGTPPTVGDSQPTVPSDGNAGMPNEGEITPPPPVVEEPTPETPGETPAGDAPGQV